MNESNTVLCLGGDARARAMAERLCMLGERVQVWGMGEWGTEQKIGRVESFAAGLASCRAVVLPMPAFDGNLCLPCPLESSEVKIHAATLFGAIGGRLPVYGGRISPAAYALAGEYGVQLYDYSLSEEVQIRNAVPTAEGAIALAMQHTDITLYGARTVVLGYGRIGMALARRLVALGAHVTVGARKAKDIARAECEGCSSLLLTDRAQLCSLCRGYDVIFNTVPHRLMDNDMLAAIPARTLLIELASGEGGFDRSIPCACRRVNGQGLPAKCAPRTAGYLLADALYQQLRGEGSV